MMNIPREIYITIHESHEFSSTLFHSSCSNIMTMTHSVQSQQQQFHSTSNNDDNNHHHQNVVHDAIFDMSVHDNDQIDYIKVLSSSHIKNIIIIGIIQLILYSLISIIMIVLVIVQNCVFLKDCCCCVSLSV
jgi:hypothetical protein